MSGNNQASKFSVNVRAKRQILMQARSILLCGILLGTVLCTLGCIIMGPLGSGGKRKTPPPPDRFGEYVEALSAKQAELQAGEDAIVDLLPTIPEGTRDAIRENASTIVQNVEEYYALVNEPQSAWSDLRVSGLQGLVSSGSRYRVEIESSIAAFDSQCEKAGRQFEVIPKNGKSSVVAKVLEPLHEYTQLCLEMRSLLKVFSSQIENLHKRVLSPNYEADSPVAKVAHFLLLSDAGGDTASVTSEFQRAWGGWVTALLDSDGSAVALQTVALGVRLGEESRALAVHQVNTIVTPCIDNPPGLDAIVSMERSITNIEAEFENRGALDKKREVEFSRARSVFKLCRAHLASDPEIGLSLAISAYKQNSQIDEPVRRFFLSAGESLVRKYALSAKYSTAVEVFARALSDSGLKDAEALGWKFREHVLNRALSDLDKLTDTGSFLSAKRVLDDAWRIARDDHERRQVRDKRYNFYLQYAWSLEETKIDSYLAVCREMLGAFPGDATSMAMLDRGHLRKLRRKIGDKSTSHSRLGARQIYALMKETTRKLQTASGAEKCQEILAEIQSAWYRELRNTEDAAIVFPLVRQIADLSGLNEADARKQGSDALNRIFVMQAYRENWNDLEICVSAMFRECPWEPKPRDFNDIYLRLIHHIESSKDLLSVARHVGYYLRESPNDRAILQPIIDRYSAEGSAGAEEFKRVLSEAIQPPSDSRHGSKQVAIVSSIVDKLFKTAKKLVTDVSDGTDSGGNAPGNLGGAGSRPGRRKISSQSVMRRKVVLGISGIGSILIILFLGVRTLRRGLCRFRWYGAGALWVGVAMGFWLGY